MSGTERRPVPFIGRHQAWRGGATLEAERAAEADRAGGRTMTSRKWRWFRIGYRTGQSGAAETPGALGAGWPAGADRAGRAVSRR